MFYSRFRNLNIKDTLLRKGKATILFIAALIVLGYVIPTYANHLPLIFLPDDGGHNDVDPNSGSQQTDLSALAVGHNQYGWQWDEAVLSGNNSHDVCMYFSINGADGLAERAICYAVSSGATSGTVEEYECPGTYSPAQQKCTGNSPLATDVTSACILTKNVTPQFSVDPDLDTQVVCTFTTNLTLTLVNICTKTGASPTSNSEDCGFTQTPANLKLLKVVSDGSAVPADFTLSYNGPGTNDGSVLGNNAQFIPVPPGTYTLSESGPNTYALDSLVCSNGDNDGTIVLASNDQVTCTFTNKLAFVPNPAISLDKSGVLNDGGDGVANAGDIINYTFAVQNTGNVNLSNVTVSDPKLQLNCLIGTLAVGATNSTTCTANYMLTQADVDAGLVDNTATATGSPPTGAPVTSQDTNTEIVLLVPGITVSKEGTLDLGIDGIATPGDLIHYEITVGNNGNQTLTGVTVNDPKLGTLTCNPTLPASVAPNASLVCTGSYAITQADIDAGEVNNTATADSNQTLPKEAPNTVDVPQAPSLDITKSGTLVVGGDGIATPGDLINYEITVSNNGNQTLTGVTVSDPKLGTLTCNPTLPATLAPNTSLVCTSSYAISQADIDAGEVNNTATADSNQTLPKEAPNTENVPQAPSVGITKVGTLVVGNDGIATPGDLINYEITVSNNGNQTLTGVTVSDPKLGTLACNPTLPATLAPNASLVCTGTYAITQADIDAGEVNNTATADSNQTDPKDTPNAVDVPQAPSLGITKEGTLDVGGDGVATPGDLIHYEITVGNNGNQTLTGATVSDLKLGALTCNPTLPATLAPNASLVCTGSYAITQADIDAGEVNNIATADSNQTGPKDSPNQEDIVREPGLNIDKQGTLVVGDDGIATPGDLINYEITVSNNGNQTLTGVTVNDLKLGTLACNPTLPATLAPNASLVCTGSYAITQADIDAGEVNNTATADSNETDPKDAPNTEAVPQAPSLGITKEGTLVVGGDGIATPGDLINYEITVSNNGNQTLTGVTVSDLKLGALTCNPTLPATLAPNASLVCTGSYAITQADIDAGEVNNTATADSNQTDAEEATNAEDVPQAPSLGITKEGTLDVGGDGVATPGDTINYTIVASNNGNQTLTGVTASDPKLGTLNCLLPLPATLAPDESVECTGSYAITQADIDAGEVNNTATADSNQTLPKEAPNTVDVPQTPSVGITKVGTLVVGNDGIATPGDLINYEITVSNNGNQTLTGVTVSDPKLGTLACNPTLPASVAPNASLVCTGSYAITQADIDAGEVNNTATADSNQTLPKEAPNTVDVPQAPSLDITKSGTLVVGGDGIATPGDLINYEITVSNNGNQTLTGVTVSDLKLGALTCNPTLPATLAPNASLVCTGTYAITQADIDAGVVNNIATADSNQTNPKEAPNTENVPQAPSLGITKEGTLVVGGDGVATPGDTINYVITVSNNGNQTLTGVTVNDLKLGTLICNPTTPATLAPNASLVCTGTYAITQADIDSGVVNNTATADSSQTAPVDGPNQTDVPQAPSLDIVKEGTLNPGVDSVATPGDLIDYVITVSNNGNQTLTEVTVSDPKLGTLTCNPTTPATLAPNASLVCTGSYAITQADIDAGLVNNTATADSDQTDPKDGPNQEDIVREPGLNIDKKGTLDVGGDGIATPGDTINYEITVNNNGNQTLSGVTVSDPKLGTLTCNPTLPATLAPNTSLVCTGSYTITQADIDAGEVNNTATTDSDQTDPKDGPNQTDVPQAPSLGITKVGTLVVGAGGIATPGDTINYEITVNNNGNQTLTGVTVSDPKLGTLTCNPTLPATLAPNASLVCTGSYAITQADIDAGVVNNTATADSDQTDPKDGFNEEDVPQAPSLGLNKEGVLDVGADGVATPGDLINYTITASNNGNQTLTGVTVSDPKLGTLICDRVTPATLAPGVSVICIGSYAITQADIDAGVVNNTATADSSQTDPEDGPNQENVPNTPGLIIAKTPDLQQVVIGGTATFTIKVTNSGNATLSNVTVSDPLSPDCNRSIDILNVGQVVEYTCTVTVSSDFTNQADVSGETKTGEQITAKDTAVVDAVKPDIEINKQVSVDKVVWSDSLAQVFAGTGVYYRFVVQNVGEVPLAYTVTDPSLGQLLFGDSNHVFCSGDLAINQSVICGPYGPTLAQYINNNATFNTATGQGCYQTTCDTDTDTTSYSAMYWAFTPGFWKNHAPPKPVGGKNAWQYTAYKDPKIPLWKSATTPTGVFTKPICTPALNISNSATLLDALGFGGGADVTGAAKNLLRAGVAALLNASFHETYEAANHPKAVIGPNGELLGANGMVYYPYSTAKVIELVNAALASCNRATMSALALSLDTYNNGVHLAPWSNTMAAAAALKALYANDLIDDDQRIFFPVMRR